MRGRSCASLSRVRSGHLLSKRKWKSIGLTRSEKVRGQWNYGRETILSRRRWTGAIEANLRSVLWFVHPGISDWCAFLAGPSQFVVFWIIDTFKLPLLECVKRFMAWIMCVNGSKIALWPSERSEQVVWKLAFCCFPKSLLLMLQRLRLPPQSFVHCLNASSNSRAAVVIRNWRLRTEDDQGFMEMRMDLSQPLQVFALLTARSGLWTGHHSYFNYWPL